MDEEARYLELLRRKVETIKDTEGPRFENAPPARVPQPEMRGLEGAGPRPEVANLEAIVLWHRPVLWIRSDEIERDYTFTDPNDQTSPDILKMLEERRSVLTPAIPAIGRIELTNNASYEWVGTGWVMATDLGSDIIVTNAHVGREFAQRSGDGFVFRRGTVDFARPQSAHIDFREEISDGKPREFAITDVIWISDDEILDVAFLRVALKAGEDRVSGPIRLAPEAAVPGRNIAVIGYPGDDSKSYDAEKFVRLFGRVFGKKRLAPGRLTEPHAWGLRHDCSTLPGNSGSVVLDIETGAAVGLHYSGAMFRANYAVPATELVRITRERPWQPGEAARKPRPPLVDPSAAITPPAAATALAVAPPDDRTGVSLGADGALKLVIPLEITVKLGSPFQPGEPQQTSVASGAAAGTRTAVTSKSDSASAEAAAEMVRKHLAGDKAILAVNADYLFRDGLITDDFGVVVRVRPDASVEPTAHGLPSHFNGVEIAVETADPEAVAVELFNLKREAFSGRQAEYERDLTDARFNLSPVTDDMKIMLHVSPEAGWPVLKQFLTDFSHNHLSIGMYHMTAPHVVAVLKELAGRNNTHITLTLDRQRGDARKPDDTEGETKKNDIPENVTLDELERIARNRFKWAPASLGGDGLFASAYHIKVAVWSDRSGNRIEDKAFWLSSGNWQSSNQPPIKRAISEIDDLTWSDVADYNREWHATVEHAGLASTFRNHLEQDYEDNEAVARTEAPMPRLPDVLVPVDMLERPRRPPQFRTFPPKVIQGRVKVQPLLTPDNYPEVVAKLITDARERVLIQNQSFSLWSEVNDTPEHFLKIVQAVRDQQKAGLDVRIIFRNIHGSEKETIRKLKKFKIKTDADHLRYFGTCHTKGIVIDKTIAILGSQNWTAAGTGPNRDASLVIWHPEANAYFAELFEYDWDQIASNRTRPEMAAGKPVQFIAPGAEAPLPPGYVRMSLAEYMGES
jgi:V8-like Glu-specific endopeptidase